jgi:hypothetical protein
MNAEMILAGVMLVGTVLSLALLLRARRISVDLWSTGLSARRIPGGNHAGCPTEAAQTFEARER